MRRVNIGCGQTLVSGYYNYDNSLSIRLARYSFLSLFLKNIRLLSEGKKEYTNYAKENNILYGDARKKLPLADRSVDVIYTSHMVEHLDRVEVRLFLTDARRVLGRGGIIRIVVPDLQKIVENYIADKDADAFMEGTGLGRNNLKSLFLKLKYLITGDRRYKWMYDGPSLVKLLSSIGFRNACIIPSCRQTSNYHNCRGGSRTAPTGLRS